MGGPARAPPRPPHPSAAGRASLGAPRPRRKAASCSVPPPQLPRKFRVGAPSRPRPPCPPAGLPPAPASRGCGRSPRARRRRRRRRARAMAGGSLGRARAVGRASVSLSRGEAEAAPSRAARAASRRPRGRIDGEAGYAKRHRRPFRKAAGRPGRAARQPLGGSCGTRRSAPPHGRAASGAALLWRGAALLEGGARPEGGPRRQRVPGPCALYRRSLRSGGGGRGKLDPPLPSRSGAAGLRARPAVPSPGSPDVAGGGLSWAWPPAPPRTEWAAWTPPATWAALNGCLSALRVARVPREAPYGTTPAASGQGLEWPWRSGRRAGARSVFFPRRPPPPPRSLDGWTGAALPPRLALLPLQRAGKLSGALWSAAPAGPRQPPRCRVWAGVCGG